MRKKRRLVTLGILSVPRRIGKGAAPNLPISEKRRSPGSGKLAQDGGAVVTRTKDVHIHPASMECPRQVFVIQLPALFNVDQMHTSAAPTIERVRVNSINPVRCCIQ